MDDNVSFTPVNFFQVSFDCHHLPEAKQAPFALSLKNYAKYLLPDVSALTGQTSFAEVAMGWSQEGLEILAIIHQPYLKALYPQYDKADSMEICLDTRDVKTSGYNTRFCHHFVFLPEAVEGLQAGELTKFRTEDMHPLCASAELAVQSSLKPDLYILQCHIPSNCLFGYDPEQFDRLGMTYRINRAQGLPQEFSVLAEDYKFQEQPSLWASVRLIK